MPISKEKSNKCKDFYLQPRDLHTEHRDLHQDPQDLHPKHRDFTLKNIQLKGFTPIHDGFHPQRHQDFAWVKLSVHPHQTISHLSLHPQDFH